MRPYGACGVEQSTIRSNEVTPNVNSNKIANTIRNRMRENDCADEPTRKVEPAESSWMHGMRASAYGGAGGVKPDARKSSRKQAGAQSRGGGVEPDAPTGTSAYG